MADAPVHAIARDVIPDPAVNKFEQFHWQFQSCHGWEDSDEHFQRAVEEAHGRGQTILKLVCGHTQYWVDLLQLTQTNEKTGRVRHLRRLQESWK